MLQLQIFGQELLAAILEVFSPLLCKQVAVLGEKEQVSLAAFAVFWQRNAGSGRESGLAAFACCPWEIEAGFGAEIWSLRRCPLLQDRFAQGCGRLR